MSQTNGSSWTELLLCNTGTETTEFEKRVLYQLALLTTEVTEHRKIIELQATSTRYSDSDTTPDTEVAHGPIHSIGVHELDEQNSEFRDETVLGKY